MDSDIVEFVVLERLGPYLRSMLADLEIEDRGLPRVSSSYANPINSHCYNCWPRSSERDVRSSRSDAYPAAKTAKICSVHASSVEKSRQERMHFP